MRVAVVALLQESNTFVDGVTTRLHFEQEGVVRGEAMRRKWGGAMHEVAGFFEILEAEGIEAVPVFAARAIPYGVIDAGDFDDLVREMLSALRAAGPVDGVLAAPHGATVAENHPDADGWWLSEVRRIIGPDKPLIATLDPHANLSEDMVRATNALVAYRTNPHIDQRETGQRAARLMARTLRGEIFPVQAAVFPPLVINIQCQNTSVPPLRDLYEWADIAGANPSVLSQSILMGFPYADVREMGAAVVVVTDGEADLAARLAKGLGDEMWNRRPAFMPSFLPVRNAVNEAQSNPGSTLLLDMGDNIGGGAPGYGTLVLEELQRRRLAPSFVCLCDPESQRLARAAGVGAWVTLPLGSPGDSLHGQPLETACRVVSLHDGKFREPEARHGGFLDYDQGPTAVVETDRGITVMLNSRRIPPFSLQQLLSCGIDPRSFRVLVAKGVIAPLAAYTPVVDRILPVNTHGVTCADVTQLPYHKRRRPLFPFEKAPLWKPEPVFGHAPGIPLQGGWGSDTGPVPASSHSTLKFTFP